jgi:hypothetical protein
MTRIHGRQKDLAKLLMAFLPLTIVCITITGKFLGLRYWWLGFATAQVLYAYLEETALQGIEALSRLTPERIALNLRFAGVSTTHRFFPFQIRLAALVLFLAFAFIATIRTDLERGFAEIGNILIPEKLILKIEYPAWTETPPTEVAMDDGEKSLAADTASVVQLRPRNGKFTRWNITLQQIESEITKNGDASKTITAQIPSGSPASWSQSVATIYERLGIESTRPTSIQITAADDSGTAFRRRINITPVGVPKVTLARSLSPQGDPDTDGRDVLFFRLSAHSKTPLTQIELEAHTKSGYRFSRIAAEFAGSFERSVDNLSTSLSLLGVPFAPNDSLFIRAAARTIVPGLVGYSPEIEITVTSPIEIKQRIVEMVEEVLKELSSDKSDFLSRKLRTLELLRGAAETATALGQRSPIKRQLNEAVQDAGRLESAKDPGVRKLEAKLKTLVEAIKRSNDLQETMSLLARIQNLQLQVRRAVPQSLPRLAPEAASLAKEAQSLKGKLGELLRDPNLGLTAEEKAQSQKLLESDETQDHLNRAAVPLGAQNGPASDAALEKASKEAQLKLGGVIQLLAGARARAIRNAQQHLTEADKKLQAARSSPPANTQNEIRSGQEELGKVPQINKDLATALDAAQEGTKEALEASKQNQSQKLEQALNKAQDGIAWAIQALQDEEEMQNNSQREMDGTEHRSRQELLTAQGLLDASWRKHILEEISRQRTKGEATDSPLLRFLESRLR